MKKEQLIQETAVFIRQHFEQEGSGHDWWHIYRVWQMARQIGEKEQVDPFRVEMAALLHDLDDWKLSQSRESQAQKWLSSIEVADVDLQAILQIIDEVSFKGAGVETRPTSLEGMVVQDADRLDAIGAIGIARTFAYGGNKNRLIYDPEVAPEQHDSFKAYQQSTAPTINHFYEKLLLLKDRMNTETGKKLAEERHQFMEAFLEQFFREWQLEEEQSTT